jgi:hypothetical protein
MQQMEQTQVLVDIGAIHGDRRNSQHATVLRHFERFLRFSNSQFQRLEQIPEDQMEKEIVGTFSDYIDKHCDKVKAYSTHDQYISCIYQEILQRFPLKAQLWANYYSHLRDNVEKQYKEKARTNVDSSYLRKHSNKMKFSDLEVICRELFNTNKLELRSLFCLDWACVGRGSEVFVILIQ